MAHKYGWKPQLKDQRDRKYLNSGYFKVAPLPPIVDLRSVDSSILDQGVLGSCTGNGIAGCINFLIKQLVSRLFIYYNERWIEGTIGQDAGANIRDGIKSVAKWGVPLEALWPYVISTFTVKPNRAAYKAALNDLAIEYLALNSIFEIKNCLASGFPVVFGTTLYDSFESPEVASTGIVPMPKDSESVLGGHCMKFVGYDDDKQLFIVANSWGTGWALAGYCLIPYSYIQNNASDFWCIQKVK
jgi:C1A family cysteine protease